MKQIPLTQGKIALVDDEDYSDLMRFKWFAFKKGNSFYVRRNSPMVQGRQSAILMHRVIINPSDDLEIDHINGDGLDNRKENLRIVTHRQNCQNRHEVKTSRYPGVHWNKMKKKWHSLIQVNGIRKHLGYFKDELDAATTYRVACVVLGGDP